MRLVLGSPLGVKSYSQVSESNTSGRSQQTWNCLQAILTDRKVLGMFYSRGTHALYMSGP
jgi:hypothetical protein